MAHMFKFLKMLVGCELRVSMGPTQGLRESLWRLEIMVHVFLSPKKE